MPAHKKNSLNRQVRRQYRQDELARILTLPEYEFGRAFGMVTTEVEQHSWWQKAKKDTPSDFYHFRDNGSRVLAVAHLDTVVPAHRRTAHFRNTQSGPYIRSGALDDRLGAYVITSLLPKLGVTHDWLLTTGEEHCQSTASFFTPEKDYDWIIEFDRGGTDVVMYQYDDAATRQAVQASGATVSEGSYSDICDLEHLGIKAFNWGAGYRGNYHSENGYAYLPDTFAMVARYLRFYAQNAGTALPHKEKREPAWWMRSTDRRNEDFLDCDTCYALQAVDPDTLICAYCDCCLGCSEDSRACTCPGGPGVWTVNRDGTASRRMNDNESGDDDELADECRHDNYTTCGCDNGLQKVASSA